MGKIYQENMKQKEQNQMKSCTTYGFEPSTAMLSVLWTALSHGHLDFQGSIIQFLLQTGLKLRSQFIHCFQFSFSYFPLSQSNFQSLPLFISSSFHLSSLELSSLHLSSFELSSLHFPSLHFASIIFHPFFTFVKVRLPGHGTSVFWGSPFKAIFAISFLIQLLPRTLELHETLPLRPCLFRDPAGAH
jgi:hypothetical protein